MPLDQDSRQQDDPTREADADDRAGQLLALGCEREHASDWEGAITAYRDALALEPRHPVIRYFAHNNLGYSLIQIGRYDEAEEHCETAIPINPGQYNAHKNLGLAREGLGRWLEAAISLAHAARLCPENPRAWQHLRQLLDRKPEVVAQAPELIATLAALEPLFRDTPKPQALH